MDKPTTQEIMDKIAALAQSIATNDYANEVSRQHIRLLQQVLNERAKEYDTRN